MVASGKIDVAQAPEPKVVRTKARPYVFQERTDTGPDEGPVEYDGFGPLDGDVVERFGRRILCRVTVDVRPRSDDETPEEGCFVSIDEATGHAEM